MKQIENAVHRTVVDMLKNKKGRVLDAGTGKGRVSTYLHEIGFDVYSCDVNPKIFKAKTKFKKANLNEKFPYKNNYFDYVVAVEVLEHLENTHHLVKEIRRVLKNNGEVIMTTPNITNIFSRMKFFLTGSFFTFGEKERKSLHGHINPVPFWKLSDVLLENKFKILNLRTVGKINLFGPKTGITGFKRIFSFFSYYLFSPFLHPRNKELLRGDILIVHARKV